MVSLPDHEAVVALFDERHFGRAARRLGVTQPALTARLRRLETDVDLRLFERSRSGVEPTEAGRAFVEGARRVLDAAREAVAAARDAQSGFGLTLRVGTTQIAVYQVVSTCLAAFRDAHPMARLTLTEGTTASLERDLELNAVDIAFLHPPLHAPGLSNHVLTRDSLEVRDVAHAGRRRPFVRFPRSEAPVLMAAIDRREDGDASDDGGGVSMAEASTAVCALALARAGYGPAIVPSDFPEFAASSDEEREQLDGLALETSVAWRAMDRRPVVKAFVEISREIVTASSGA